MKKQVRRQALERQVERLRRRSVELNQQSGRLSWLRAAIFFGGLVIIGAILYFFGIWPFWFSLAIFTILFGVAIFYHRRVEERLLRHQGWQQLKLTQIARMQLDWSQIPALSRYEPDPEHPFEADLDLLGARSLHRLVDTAVSREGSQLLVEWLTAPVPDLAQITRRQQLVRELIPLSLFRHKLILNATVSAGTRKIWDATRLLTWLERRSSNRVLGFWLVVFGLWAVLNLALIGLNRAGLLPPIWQFSLPFYLVAFLAVSRITGSTFEDALELQTAIQQLAAVFQQLESFSYRHSPHLRTLCAPFLEPGQSPSQHLNRLKLVVAATGLRSNPYLWFILHALIPWDIYFAYRLNQLKAGMVDRAPRWLESWFELEALSALANLAYLNPAYHLPTIFEIGAKQTCSQNDKGRQLVFQSRALGHPLLPDRQKVCNDFSLAELGEIALITGSNMAGKSTFLRTVGVNLALAFAGGPVNAESLQTGLFRLFSCIKVSDSVTDGTSYFYAEVKRLKALLLALEEAGALPLFFLIDEIFRGTNNRERMIGSQAYVHALVEKNGAGLISTHDLELTKLADQTPRIKNYHFRDDIRNGEMVFDYTLHAGPCPTTNALKIMQQAGLPV